MKFKIEHESTQLDLFIVRERLNSLSYNALFVQYKKPNGANQTKGGRLVSGRRVLLKAYTRISSAMVRITGLRLEALFIRSLANHVLPARFKSPFPNIFFSPSRRNSFL